METKCQKCGAAASDEQAFCSKCGAVLGMGDAGQPREDSPPNLAATVVGKFPFTPPTKPASQPPPPKPAPTPPAPQPQSAQVPAGTPPPAPARPQPQQPQPQPHVLPPSLTAPPKSGGGNATLLVIIGFVAVLLVGALLIYLFLFNLR
jgi:hypothetical protein